MKNNFKDIKGYEGLYTINSDGIIKSYHFNKEKVMKSCANSKGYFVIYLSNGRRKMFALHRLVAQAFIPNPNNFPEINHKDGNKSNNRANNLEWCTESMNCLHASKMGLRTALKGEKSPKAKLTDKQVITIKKELNNYKRGLVKVLAQQYNVKRQTITNIKTNIHWEHITI